MRLGARLLIMALVFAPVVVFSRDGDHVEASQSSRMEYMNRLDQVASMGPDALAGLLLDTGSCANMSLVQERFVLNEVMNRLRQLYREDTGLEAVLIQVATDTSRDLGVREYALQHMMLLYEASGHKEQIAQCLFDMAQVAPLDVAALLQLHHLRQTFEVVDEATFNAWVQASSRRGDLRNADRITLLAIASASHISEILPQVRAWGTNPSSRGVAVDAIEFIATFGGEEDLALLEQMQPTADYYGIQAQLTLAQAQLSQHTYNVKKGDLHD